MVYRTCEAEAADPERKTVYVTVVTQAPQRSWLLLLQHLQALQHQPAHDGPLYGKHANRHYPRPVPGRTI
jgi:hypothetical protein